MKTLKAAVPIAIAGLMKTLVLSMFFVGLLSLNSYADDGQDLIEAAGNGDISRVKALLNKGANVNEKDGNDNTPLSFASGEITLNMESGDVFMYKEALDSRKNVNIEEIVQLLKKAGAK